MNRLNPYPTYLMMVLVFSLFFVKFSLVFAEEFSYDSHGKRDPFISPLSGGGAVEQQLSYGNLRLEGIVVDLKGQSYAIVNGEIVKEGQSLQGFVLKKVMPKEVQFEHDGEVISIPLRQDDELLMNQYLSDDTQQ